jgi:hypothetical protein
MAKKLQLMSFQNNNLHLLVLYIADMAARFGSTDADEFTFQQQNVKTKAATKYAVKVLSDFMLGMVVLV